MEAGEPGLTVSKLTHYVGEDVIGGHNYWDISLDTIHRFFNCSSPTGLVKVEQLSKVPLGLKIIKDSLLGHQSLTCV